MRVREQTLALTIEGAGWRGGTCWGTYGGTPCGLARVDCAGQASELVSRLANGCLAACAAAADDDGAVAVVAVPTLAEVGAT